MKKILMTNRRDLTPEQAVALNALGTLTYYEAPPNDAADWLSRCKGYAFVCSGKEGLLWPWLPGGDLNDFGVYYLAEGTTVFMPFADVKRIEAERLKAGGIRLCYAPGSNAEAVGVWVMAAITEHFRTFSKVVNLTDPDVTLARTRDLYDASITVLGGLGAVGSVVTRLALAYGMYVVCYCRKVPNGPDWIPGVRYYTDLGSSVQSADVVVNCLSSWPQNKELLSLLFFRSMKQGAFFVSMTNPFIWCIPDLITMLDKGHLAGAAIDIGDKSPGDITALRYQDLVGHPKIRATPQIAHWTYHTAEVGYDMMLEALTAAIDGKEELPHEWLGMRKKSAWGETG